MQHNIRHKYETVLQHLLFYMNAPEVSATYTAEDVPDETEGQKADFKLPVKRAIGSFPGL